MNIEKREYLTKGDILGWFGWQMSGQPMIFPFVQYSLIFNIHLYMIWHLEYDWYIKYLPNLILILALCNGNDTCCTSSNQCDIGEGDCDKDLDCIGNLFCGKDNCVGDTFEEDDDCCTDSSQLKNQISEY